MHEEILEIVDREGKARGLAPRSEVHGNPAPLHSEITKYLSCRGPV